MLLVFNIEEMGKSGLGSTPLIKLIVLHIDVVLTAVRFKVPVLLLLTCCFIVTSIVGVCNCFMFVCPFKFCNHLDGEERAGCFA